MKYFQSKAGYCPNCETHPLPHKVENNPKAVWGPGITYVCKCRKTKLWANALRGKGIPDVLPYLRGDEQRHFAGVCNDMYCAKCWSDIEWLKNNFDHKWKKPNHPRSVDLAGCSKERCANLLLVDRSSLLPEVDTSRARDYEHYQYYKKILLRGRAIKEHTVTTLRAILFGGS